MDETNHGMGVSSERVGPTGSGQEATDGTKDTSLLPDEDLPDDAPPEQSAGNPEDNPSGLPPKAGYSSVDPRSDGEPVKKQGDALRNPGT